MNHVVFNKFLNCGMYQEFLILASSIIKYLKDESVIIIFLLPNILVSSNIQLAITTYFICILECILLIFFFYNRLMDQH